MKNIIAIFLIGIFLLSSCKNKAQPTEVIDGMSFFGEKITPEGAITYDELLAMLETNESVENVKIKGKIDGVCQAKGCWMNIVSENNTDDEGFFVKFTDYGFFMPLDASGNTAIMSGRAYKEETSVDELRHYAEDEGKSAEEIAAITEPVTELKFMADGVIIL
ncbi:MAG: hypothetical protein ACJA1A_000616 [Saprospiraceae bacterium]|jgi:hypothetical protein|tara:strand:- start:108 stop:596 length:489 start_codon:yes stop_codon:yes gene_type:complete